MFELIVFRFGNWGLDVFECRHSAMMVDEMPFPNRQNNRGATHPVIAGGDVDLNQVFLWCDDAKSPFNALSHSIDWGHDEIVN